MDLRKIFVRDWKFIHENEESTSRPLWLVWILRSFLRLFLSRRCSTFTLQPEINQKKKTAHTPVSYTITDLRSNSVPSKTKKNSPAVSSSGISLCLTTFHDETLQKNDEKRWESVAERWESAWLGPSQRSLPLGLGFSAQRESERERVLEIEIIERDMCFCFVGVVRDKKAFVKGYAMPKKK